MSKTYVNGRALLGDAVAVVPIPIVHNQVLVLGFYVGTEI